ncbi:MAG TPA: mechanosensitive ion channel family protein [Burkholderiales bacterium]
MHGIVYRLLERFGVTSADDWAAFVVSGLRVLIIVIVAWVVLAVARRLIRLSRKRMLSKDPDPEQAKRIETLTRVFGYIASVTIFIVAGMLILAELGVSIAPVLATAGVAGIAIGFGAQSLIKDYFTGFFLLLENQIRQGDVVNVAGIGGYVEEVTLRYVRLRDYDGNVHFIPNGIITTVANLTREFAFAVIDVRVAYGENIDRAIAVIKDVARELREDPVFSLLILEELEMAGVERLEESAAIVRCRFKTMPIQQWNVRREYHRRLINRFGEVGIEFPYPRRIVHQGDESDASTALRTLGIAPR